MHKLDVRFLFHVDVSQLVELLLEKETESDFVLEFHLHVLGVSEYAHPVVLEFGAFQLNLILLGPQILVVLNESLLLLDNVHVRLLHFFVQGIQLLHIGLLHRLGDQLVI